MVEPAGEDRAPFAPTPSSEDPLVAALREENTRLRDHNHSLQRQLAATQAAQAEIVKVLRLTAPLRRIQEVARLKRQERRRAATLLRPNDHQGWAEPTGPSGQDAAEVPVLTITDAQAERYPLLARTRDWAAGQPISRPETLPVGTHVNGRVLVVAHVYYPEIWPDLVKRIQRIPVPYDVVVTLVEDHSDQLLDQIVAQFPKVVIETLPNHGRDMWPFVRVAQLGLIGNYDAVLKIHTKRSVHRLDGTAWRRRLLDALCPSPEGIGLMLELFRRDPSLGMIAPAGALMGREFWGSNTALIEALALRTGVPVEAERVWFPGGSMFWSRPAPLNRLRDTELSVDDFEHDTAVLDSTTAHALERFFGVLVTASGMNVIDTGEVAGRLATARATDARAREARLRRARVTPISRIAR